MTNAILIVFLIVGPLVAYLVVLTLPKWLARSLHGHRMWRLRDAVVDDALRGQLPRDHKAVQQLLRFMDAALHDERATLLDMYIVRRACSPELLAATQKQGFGCPLDGLSANERKLVEDYRTRFMTLLVGSMLLGSWFGIAHILPFVPAGIAAAMRQAGVATRDGIKHRLEHLKVERDFWASAREATDIAASRSRVGQQAAVYAMRHEGVLHRDTVGAGHFVTPSRH
jgi:hypothetical protein